MPCEKITLFLRFVEIQICPQILHNKENEGENQDFRFNCDPILL